MLQYYFRKWSFLHESTYNNQQVAAVNIRTHCTILKWKKKNIEGHLRYKNLQTYPRLGPFGAMNGKTMPTTPKIAEKIMIGKADAPMIAEELR